MTSVRDARLRTPDRHPAEFREGYPRGRLGRGLTVLLLVAPLTGCLGLPRSDGPPAIAPLPPVVQRGGLFEGAAAREHRRLAASFGGEMRAPGVERIAAEVAGRLAPVAGAEGGPTSYRVTLLNSPSVNAFALPTGDLYLTRGLLALANDTSELAAVIAHEMAHVAANHAISRAERELRSALVTRVVAEVLNDPGSSDLIQVASRADLAGFSRAQELEADKIGVRLVAKAGFDPYGAVRFLNALGRHSASRSAFLGDRQNAVAEFLSTHPSTPERIALAMSAAREISAPGMGKADRAAYLAAIDGLAYGEDPSGGVVRGRLYLNTRLSVAFAAPEGYLMEAGPQAVIGLRPSGGEALRFDRLDADGIDPEVALGTGWIDGVILSKPERLTIGGLPAATVTGKGQDWQFRFVAIRHGESLYRLIYAAKERFHEADRGFRASMASFRPMSPDEIARVRPLRLRVMTAQAGDSAEALATRMTGVDRPLERFLILNGLERGQALVPGQGYKIVTE